jgi:glycosyltransferase involved in cell wall biosynthesis
MTLSDLSDYLGNLLPEVEQAEACTLPCWVDEVIVVDGHSTDDTAVARALRPDAKVIAQPGTGRGTR